MRAAAGALLHDIARALPPPFDEHSSPSLAGGDAGYALFKGYWVLSGILSQEQCRRHQSSMMDYLQSALDKLPRIAHRPDFISGIAGVAWTVNHLNRLGSVRDCEDLCDPLDEVLIERLDRSDSMLCELLTGLSGIGLYALGRRNRPSGRKILERVLGALEASAVEHNGFRTWFNQREKLSAISRQSTPNGCYNLGLSHGVPGAIAFLAQAASAGMPLAQKLVGDAAAWLLAQRRQYRNGSMFTYSFLADPTEDMAGTRLAWCYGDLGISAALLLSAQCLRATAWEASALEMARNAARRSEEGSGVRDAGLCHGAFGNAHIFRRLYGATREQCFVEAAVRWMRAGFAMRREGVGLAGFRAWAPAQSNEPERDPWLAEPGFLEGICGIGLVLLGMTSPVEPRWDEALMLNVRPKEA